MTETIKINPENQITLSADALAALGVKAGDEVELVATGEGHIEIRPRRWTFGDLRGIVRLDRPVSSEELDRWIAESKGPTRPKDSE